MKETTYDHLEKIRADVRDEIKRRIEQRDKYSIQLTVVLSAIVALAFSNEGLRGTLLAAPLASIYFTVLILYSYRIHRLLAQYLREEIEPRLARVAELDVDVEWENYYKSQPAIPGIRYRFFLTALWVVTAVSLVYLWLSDETEQVSGSALLGAAVVYVTGCFAVSFLFRRN